MYRLAAALMHENENVGGGAAKKRKASSPASSAISSFIDGWPRGAKARGAGTAASSASRQLFMADKASLAIFLGGNAKYIAPV